MGKESGFSYDENIVRRGWGLRGVCSTRALRKGLGVKGGAAARGMERRLEASWGISGQENFPLGAAQGVRAVRRGRFLKGRVRVRCTDKRGAGDELPQWELIILLREARSGRADKQQAPHPM